MPPPAGLVSWWPGDGNTNDIQGGNNRTLQNGATFAAGAVGQAFSFDGVDDVVSVADTPNLRFGPTSPMTVDMWVLRTSSNPRQHLIGKRTGCTGSSTEGTFQLYLNTDTAEGLGFANPGGSCACSGQNLPLNTWTHLAGTFDGAILRLFINGQLAATANGSLGPANTAPLLLGGSGTCEKFGGLLDEVEIFDRALSASEVQSIVAAGSVGKCRPNLRITGIALLTNDVRITWQTTGGQTNQLQVAPAGPGGSFNTNFTDLGPPVVVQGGGVVITNQTEVGGATNPARYYRVRVAP